MRLIANAVGGHRLLALAALATQLIASATAFSPSALTDDESAGLFARATGKYVGSPCSTNDECYSKNCITDGNGAPFTCHRQGPGGPCFEDANCVSLNCNTEGRCEYSEVSQPCDFYTDCLGFLNMTTHCVNKVCKLDPGNVCSSDSVCGSGFCSNGICRERPQAPNAACQIDSECLSNSCITTPYNKCTTINGTYTECPYSPSGKQCSRYPLGSKCANNGECAQGVCTGGTCTAGADGTTCYEQYQCTGTCLNNKCFTPNTGTLRPNDPCQTDSQCVSGRCTTTQTLKDSYGVNNPFSPFPNQNPARCDFLKNGESGCQRFTDCLTGVCVSGTCRAGQDGDRCQVNYNCANLCGLDGVCYTATGPQGAGQACKTKFQCLSGSCTLKYASVTRPNVQGTTDFPVQVDDSSCDPSVLNGACKVNDDCGEGVCRSGKCTLQSLGGTCTRDPQCIYGYCYYANEYGTTGVCDTAPYFYNCTSDAGCYSGDCESVYFPYRRRSLGAAAAILPPVELSERSPPSNPHYELRCGGQSLGESCRNYLDCAPDTELTCGPAKKCVSRNGFSCKNNNGCLSKNCGKDGLCAEAPATTSTTKTSTTKKSTTTTTTTTTTKKKSSTTTKTTTTTTPTSTKKPTATVTKPTASRTA